ncbi:MAG: hypothetical protein HC859_07675 [Bacteroidia bacterium]|nr:hypothetical protein [Bacteroidia bacterium]
MVIGLILLGVAGWGTFTYILPIVFTMIGQVLGAISAAVLVIAFFIFLPVIIKGLKKLARAFHKLLIRYDPFGELEEQKQKMIQNRQHFKTAKAKIRSIKTNMETESTKAEKETKEYQERVGAATGARRENEIKDGRHGPHQRRGRQGNR